MIYEDAHYHHHHNFIVVSMIIECEIKERNISSYRSRMIDKDGHHHYH